MFSSVFISEIVREKSVPLAISLISEIKTNFIKKSKAKTVDLNYCLNCPSYSDFVYFSSYHLLLIFIRETSSFYLEG